MIGVVRMGETRHEGCTRGPVLVVLIKLKWSLMGLRLGLATIFSHADIQCAIARSLTNVLYQTSYHAHA